MRDEKFYITDMISTETLGEICRALGESFVVYGSANNVIIFQIVES